MNRQSNPLVTIGIPTYNRADSYLVEALESALNQTYDNIEIIVSDNCSTDNTEEIVKGYKDNRIKYYKQEDPIKPNDNFNFCLNNARGVYFLLLHDDDKIDKDFIDVCMNSFNNRNKPDMPGIIRTGSRIINDSGNTIRKIKNITDQCSFEELVLSWFRGETELLLCSTLFHTQYLRVIGGFNSKKFLYQDVIAEFILAAKYGRLDVSDVKASFRRHSYNYGASQKVIEWCEESIYLIEILCELSPKHTDLFYREGVPKLARKTYRLADRINIWSEWYKTLRKINQMFDYRYTPKRYYYDIMINKRLVAIKNKILL